MNVDESSKSGKPITIIGDSPLQSIPNSVVIKAQPIIATNNSNYTCLYTEHLLSVDRIPEYENLSTIIYIWGDNPANKNNGTQITNDYWNPTVYRSLSNIKISSVSCSESHIIFLTCFRTVYTIGRGEYGQLGLGRNIQHVSEPTLVQGLNSIKQIACGCFHTVVLAENGKVYSWGRNDFSGHAKGYATFVPKELLTDSTDEAGNLRRICKCIAASDTQTIAACDGGTTLYIWGQYFNGEKIPYPKLFYSFTNDSTQEIAVGKYFALILTENGNVYSCGDSTYGEVPGNSGSTHSILIPAKIRGSHFKNIVKVAAGHRHALLIDKSFKVWSFGDNIYGQCGTVPAHHVSPTVVDFNESRFKIRDIYCGPRHSACINNGNQLYTWGHSSCHKLIFTASVDILIQQQRQPGVSITSGFKNCCSQPRLIYSMLHEKITCVGLGPDYTVVISGEGDYRPAAEDKSHTQDES